MGQYFDYSTPALPDLSEGISKVGDALTVMLDRRRQQQQFDATMGFHREQETRKFKAEQDQQAYQNKLANEKELRDKAAFAQQNAEFERRAGADIASHVADADIQGATAIAARTPHFDPATGKTTYGTLTPGPMRDVGPEPQAQPAEARPQEPAPPEVLAMRRARAKPPEPTAMVGPVPSEQIAMDAAAQRTFGQPNATEQIHAASAERAKQEADVRRYEREFQAYRAKAEANNQARADELATYPAKQAEARQAQRAFDETQAAVPQAHDKWLTEKRRAENEVPYTLKFGNEAPVTLDVQTQRYQHRQANADDFLHSHAPGAVTEKDRQALQAAHAAILDGLPVKDAEKQFQAERMGIAKEAMTRELAGESNKTRVKVAEIGATKPSITLQERGLSDKESDTKIKRTREDIERAFKDAGLDKAGDQLQQIQHVKEQVQGNGRDQQTAMLELLRSSVGKSNRLNQYLEKKYGANSGLGTVAGMINFFSQSASGELSDEAKAIALDTAREVERDLHRRIGETATKTHKNISGHPEFYDPGYGETVLEQTIPGYSATSTGPAPPPEVKARQRGRSAKLTGLTPEQLDEEIRRARASGAVP